MAIWVDLQLYHIARAECTSQLMGVLTNFNFFDILKGNDRYVFSLWSIPDYLTWLIENRSSGALSAEAFNLQFQHFDQYIHHELAALPPLYQKCIPAAVSLTTFYGWSDNSARIIVIIGSFFDISQLFYSHPETRKLDERFQNVLPCLADVFRDPSRSGPFCVTGLAYKNLAFRISRRPADQDGRSEAVVNEYKKTAIECLMLALPKASKSFEMAKFLREHALQVCFTDHLYKERHELAALCLRYIMYCGVLPWNPKHHDNHSCIVCEESTHYLLLEGVQMWVRSLLGFRSTHKFWTE
ncbi:hypothetical protein M413DRAFT_423805 [Hebeloma cylindrosporum]|uniref:Uncharacterized protein n=1 Tax=Hebeloma cylindrosporum TaxID=76867 RepID=A0A0C2XGH4_HEBCY|nr:hypothetical protein M413DRAFT_423805 [Hebeloma cylindrosporum h7]